jgi:hypothetical protein
VFPGGSWGGSMVWYGMVVKGWIAKGRGMRKEGNRIDGVYEWGNEWLDL